MTAVHLRQIPGICATCLLLWLPDGLISPKATAAAAAFIQFRQPLSERSMKLRQLATWESASSSTSSLDAQLSSWKVAGNINQFQRRNCVSATTLNVASKKRSIPEGDRPSSSPASPVPFDSDDAMSSSWLTSDLEGEGIGASFSTRQEEEESGSKHIPSGGISVSDAMETALLDRFVSSVVPVETLPKGSAAHIVTSSTTSASLEPSRYLVALSSPSSSSLQPSQHHLDYCLVDVPPFTSQLVDEMNAFMAPSKGRLRLIVVTSRDAIHYDSASSTDYETMVRKSDLHKWKSAFPDVTVVSYRLDTPRDCREVVTQVLDGYGPFALDDSHEDSSGDAGSTMKFVETGRPLTVEEWDFNVAQDVMSGKAQPPDDDSGDDSVSVSDESLYSPEKICEREVGKRLLAVYTPGHTYGSLSYVFPEVGVCCSGYAIPVEDSRLNQYDGDDDGDEGNGFGTNYGTGPILDCRGYITTSRAGIQRQMESARNLIQQYGDRFEVILPSRGDPLLWLPTSVEERKNVLLDIVRQYETIGTIYEDLGITSSTGTSSQ